MRFQANIETKPDIAGSTKRPKGKEIGLTRLTNIHTIDPIKNVIEAVIIYTFVLLEVSNLRIYAMMAPG